MEKGEGRFWLSYADLTTNLFFLFFILFSVAIIWAKESSKEAAATEAELAKIREIQEAIENIDTMYFRYDSVHKKHILKIDFLFPVGSANINRIFPDKRPELLEAGKVIKNFIAKIDTINYLVLIEGQASKDNWKGNDVLSYYRAQALIKFWQQHDINLKQLENCEIVIAGSGIGGIPRDTPDIPPANQRFLITIVPKIGVIQDSD